jgi:ketosteroid isomerase-like protein
MLTLSTAFSLPLQKEGGSAELVEFNGTPKGIKMVICPQCNIEHNAAEEYCRKCGKFLLTVEEPTPEEEEKKVNLICPKCRVLFRKGNYCRKCGSLLMHGMPSQETDLQPLEKKLVKRWSKEWVRLLSEEKELESCMSKLEAQRDKVSSDVLNPIFVHYKDRLKSLSPLHQEIETELELARKRASEEIDFLEKELKPLQKRLGEFQSLYKLRAITKPDFLREKKELRKEIKSRERSLKKHQQILSLLPGKGEGRHVSPRIVGNLFRPLGLGIAGVILLFMLGGGYFLWQQHALSSMPVSKETVPNPPPSPTRYQTPPEDRDAEKIRTLFEKIKQANLQKNIDLFMSCYSRDFSDREGKRLDALETWGFFNYHDLSYHLKTQVISGDTANVRLEWLIRISKKAGGKVENKKSLMEVTLKREDGGWKIKEIKSVS